MRSKGKFSRLLYEENKEHLQRGLRYNIKTDLLIIVIAMIFQK
jgi:hypothetical protein